MAFIQFLPHYIKIKGGAGEVYPVIAMEIKQNKEVIGIPREAPKPKAQIEPGAVVFDGEESEPQVKFEKAAVVMDIWFCIGDEIKGEYLWVHSSDAIYAGTKNSMNKIKK